MSTYKQVKKHRKIIMSEGRYAALLNAYFFNEGGGYSV